MSNSVLRVLTALIGIPAVVGLLYLGGWPFALLVLFVAMIAQDEMYRLLEAGGLHPQRWLGLGLGALFVLQALYRPLLFAAVVLFVAAVVWYPFERRSLETEPLGLRPQGVGSLAATLFGAVYPSGLLAFLIEIRLETGPQVDDAIAFYLTLMVFLLVWSTDSLAYYVGRAIGKTPLAPAVSPKKTWAGAVGGVAGALVAAAILKVTLLEPVAWVHMMAVAVMASVAGQLGDLAESKLKRQSGVKDSGALLPGHGGLLDRFDAMIVVAPVVYVYLRFVAGLFGS